MASANDSSYNNQNGQDHKHEQNTEDVVKKDNNLHDNTANHVSNRETNNDETVDSNHEDSKLLQNSVDTITEDPNIVIPPDGGWGWMVVFASFMCNLIVDGIIFSFGTFLADISAEFTASRAQVTLVGSLMSGFYLIVGPFASALANKYGFRLVAILGAILGGIAFAISYFANSVLFLYVSYGVLGGIGFGFIYVPSIITVGYYFDRWRALATGIGVCGSGIGTFLFAPLSEAMISSMGWRNTLLVQGGIVLSCSIYGALFRPLKPTNKQDLNKNETKELPTTTIPELTAKKQKYFVDELNKSMQDQQSPFLKLFGAHLHNNHNKVYDVYHTVNVPTIKYENKEKRLSIPMISTSDIYKPTVIPRSNTVFHQDFDRPLYRKDVFFVASVTRLPQYASTKSMHQYQLSVANSLIHEIEEEKNEERKHDKSCSFCTQAVKRVLAKMLDFSLLKSPTFLIMAMGGFFTMMGFYVPFMYLVDRAKDSMDKKTAVLLVSSIGIANTIGRVLCGVLTSFPGVNALLVTNAALTVGGLATIFSGLSLTAEYQFVYTVIFGLAISCFASLRSIIVVDLLGLEKLTNAFGLLCLFQGAAAIVGAPLAGAFMEATGSYDASFYLSGSMILISAVMCYPLNWVRKWEDRKLRKAIVDNKA